MFGQCEIGLKILKADLEFRESPPRMRNGCSIGDGLGMFSIIAVGIARTNKKSGAQLEALILFHGQKYKLKIWRSGNRVLRVVTDRVGHVARWWTCGPWRGAVVVRHSE